jgi:Skp family chaperone for outer membrane proteins
MEPITVLMGSFTAIKAGVSAGREITTLAKDVGKLFDAIDDIRNDHNKAKGNPLRSANEEAMQTFIAKKKAEDIEKELRNIVIATRGMNGWHELQKLRADIRHDRAEAEKKRKKERAEFVDNVWTVILVLLGIAIVVGAGFGGLWIAKRRGLI